MLIGVCGLADELDIDYLRQGFAKLFKDFAIFANQAIVLGADGRWGDEVLLLEYEVRQFNQFDCELFVPLPIHRLLFFTIKFIKEATKVGEKLSSISPQALRQDELNI